MVGGFAPRPHLGVGEGRRAPKYYRIWGEPSEIWLTPGRCIHKQAPRHAPRRSAHPSRLKGRSHRAGARVPGRGAKSELAGVAKFDRISRSAISFTRLTP